MLTQKLIPDQETETAEDDQHRKRQTDDRILLIDRQAAPVKLKAQDVKTGVAERGNSVKNAEFQRLRKGKFGKEPKSKDQRTGSFHRKGTDKQALLMGNHITHIAGTDGFSDHHLLLDGDFPFQAEPG